jgi:hypothetical protein
MIAVIARTTVLALAALAAAGCDFYLQVADAVDAGPGAPDAYVPPDAHVPPGPGEIPAQCQEPLPCAAAPAGRMRICGALFDIETSGQIAAADPQPQRCAAVTGDGPCSLQVKLYDALGFANNPETAQPLATDEDEAGVAFLDDCGRFHATISLSGAPSGFVAIAVTDADASAADSWGHAWVALPTVSRISGQKVYAVRHSTDAQWTSTAGLADESFATRGAFLPIFLHDGERVAGVQVRREGTADPSNAYYFSDDDPAVIRTVDPAQDATGANGAALFVRRGLVNFDGIGGEPDGCAWPSALAGVVAGVVHIQEREAVCE